MRKKRLIAPVFTALTTVSATPSTASCPKPTVTVFPGLSSNPPSSFARAITAEKSLGRPCARSGMWTTPGHATSPVVKIRSA